MDACCDVQKTHCVNAQKPDLVTPILATCMIKRGCGRTKLAIPTDPANSTLTDGCIIDNPIANGMCVFSYLLTTDFAGFITELDPTNSGCGTVVQGGDSKEFKDACCFKQRDFCIKSTYVTDPRNAGLVKCMTDRSCSSEYLQEADFQPFSTGLAIIPELTNRCG